MTSHDAMRLIMADEATAQHNNLALYQMAHEHRWLADVLVERQLLALLDYAPMESRVRSMHALLYAYAHPGTREGLCQLCLGLFGYDSLIIVEESAARITLNLSITNRSFFYTLADANYAIADEDGGYSIADFSLDSISNDPIYFLRQFIPVGVVLEAIHITLRPDDEPSITRYYAIADEDGGDSIADEDGGYALADIAVFNYE